MQVAEGETKKFLGQEFLTWLWYYGEQHDWKINLSKDECVEFGMELDDEKPKELLVFEPEDDNQCIPRLQGGGTRESKEADVCLQLGKKLSIAKMCVVYSGQVWAFTCRGDRLSISGLTLETPDNLIEDSDRLQELAQRLEKFNEVFDKLYYSFLAVRLSPAWMKKELPAIREWIQTRSQKKDEEN